jgi:ABC-type glutathione transport system ATPase component
VGSRSAWSSRRLSECGNEYTALERDLGDLLDVPVRKLSLGQRIRCELAASLLHHPRLLFLDEPTIGIDVVVKQQIRTLLEAWNRDHQVTLFLTSHDLGDVEKISRRALLIHHGRLVPQTGRSIRVSLRCHGRGLRCSSVTYLRVCALVAPRPRPRSLRGTRNDLPV